MKIKRVENKRIPPGGFHKEFSIGSDLFDNLRAGKTIEISEELFSEIKDRCGDAIEVVKEIFKKKSEDKGSK